MHVIGLSRSIAVYFALVASTAMGQIVTALTGQYFVIFGLCKLFHFFDESQQSFVETLQLATDFLVGQLTAVHL